MGRIKKGILGGFTGKVGPVSGYERLGMSQMRTAHSDVIDKPTIKRLGQREKIKICNIFTNAFKGRGFFAKSFPAYGHGGTGYNRAMGCLMNLSLMGEYPSIILSYPHVLISKGSLPPAENALAVADEEGNLQFSWAINTATGTAKATDKVMLVAYFPAKGEAMFTLDKGSRGDGQATLNTAVMKGYTAETWLGFLSEDEKDASTSVYAGRLIL